MNAREIIGGAVFKISNEHRAVPILTVGAAFVLTDAVLAALSDAGIELATRTHDASCCIRPHYGPRFEPCPGVLVPLSESPQ